MQVARSHLWHGHGEQHPVSGKMPLSFELRAFHARKFAAGGIVQENRFMFPVDSRYHNIVQRRPLAAGLKADDQRPSIRQMVSQIVPDAGDGKHAKARFRKIPFHVGGENAAGLPRIELMLNLGHIGARGRYIRAVSAPVLQEHRNRGGAAAIFSLLDERDFEPHPRAPLGRRRGGASQENDQERNESETLVPRKETSPESGLSEQRER